MLNVNMEVVYFVCGCIWGAQAFINNQSGFKFTEAGRADGTSYILKVNYGKYRAL